MIPHGSMNVIVDRLGSLCHEECELGAYRFLVAIISHRERRKENLSYFLIVPLQQRLSLNGCVPGACFSSYASKEQELKGSMMEISIEDFCQLYREKPDDALASLKGLDNEQAAAVLIDAGGVLSETSL